MSSTTLVNVNPLGSAVSLLDDELTEVIDTASNASYTFISQTYLDDAATTDAVWRCFRVTNANGTKRWATNAATGKRTRAFMFQASAAATYTY